jgi:hypothetical protein
VLSLPLLLKKGGEGRGEEALFIGFPSLQLSPRSFLAGRESQKAASVPRAKHNWRVACATHRDFHTGSEGHAPTNRQLRDASTNRGCLPVFSRAEELSLLQPGAEFMKGDNGFKLSGLIASLPTFPLDIV